MNELQKAEAEMVSKADHFLAQEISKERSKIELRFNAGNS